MFKKKKRLLNINAIKQSVLTPKPFSTNTAKWVPKCFSLFSDLVLIYSVYPHKLNNTKDVFKVKVLLSIKDSKVV